jgi:uncharacterized membrane protein YraQ (UPF0718 family)/YHS domain-containing protein
VSTVWQSLSEAFFMLWQTLWALILGFTLSGVVQAFVSRRQMRRVMGDHRATTIARSSLLGMASSSCSYAASALARTLFGRGADFTASMVFMVASTNLVLELGLVLWLLIGWQFAAAEFVGGAIMVALLAVVLPRALPNSELVAAQRAIATELPRQPDDEASTLRQRLAQKSRWVAAVGYTISDLTMLRREIVIGFVVAGFLAVGVPTGVWDSVFLHGHGAATTIENAAIAPAVAIVSFVCSIGNVPLAAALWQHDVSFGGVIAFVFADLISFPLLVIYRKFYGTRLTVRLLAVFWLVMSVSGLLTELIFRGIGAVPTTRPTLVADKHFAWDHTTWLNVFFLVVIASLYTAYRRRDRTTATAHVTDPVCGMQVERTNPGASLRVGDDIIYFCSTRCHERYERSLV